MEEEAMIEAALQGTEPDVEFGDFEPDHTPFMTEDYDFRNEEAAQEQMDFEAGYDSY